MKRFTYEKNGSMYVQATIERSRKRSRLEKGAVTAVNDVKEEDILNDIERAVFLSQRKEGGLQ